MKKRRFRLLACGVSLAAAASQPLAAYAAEDFQFNTVSVLGTTRAKPDVVNGLGTDNGHREELQFEHFGVTKWGYFYFDLETFYGQGVGSVRPYGDNGSAAGLYTAATPSISLSKITGRSFTLGPISDVSLVALLRLSSYYRWTARGVGVSLNFYVPGFDWFESGLLTHDTSWNLDPTTFGTNTGTNYTLDKHKWLWRTYLVTKPIDIGSQRFDASFFSVINTTGNGGANSHGTEYFLRGDFTWEIGGNSDYKLGIRYEYIRHRNSPFINFGEKRYTANVPSLIFKGTL
jgi:hypothetical protein